MFFDASADLRRHKKHLRLKMLGFLMLCRGESSRKSIGILASEDY